jgi:histidinol-phosphate aminotransferase
VLKVRQCIREMRAYSSPLETPPADLRLDLNENTTGCSPRVLAKLRSIDASTLSLYSSRESRERLVADSVGVQPGQLILTNGADEAIDLLCRAYLDAGDEIIVVVPAFAMYEVFAQASGAKVVRVPAGPEFAFPCEKILHAIGPLTRMVVITNPNNPTGAMASRSDILKVLHAGPDAAVLLDEAYFDFCSQTMMDQVGSIPNLFVARTFSKAYGLAGLRIGVLAGDAAQMAMLRRVCPPFNLNAVALECLAEALADREFVSNYVRQIKTTREWVRLQLEDLGFKCWPSETNFIFCRFGIAKTSILKSLRDAGISLRDRPDCEGCVRISIGKQQEMEHVIAELKRAVAQIAPVQQVAP